MFSHLSLHYDENIGNGIIFSIHVTWTYYMTEFCVFDSFFCRCVKNADGERRPVPRLQPNVYSMFGYIFALLTNNIIGRIYSGRSRGGGGVKRGVLTPLSRTILTKNRPKLWKHHYLPKFKPKKIVFEDLLIIMYFFWLEDNWFFIGPPPLFFNYM